MLNKTIQKHFEKNKDLYENLTKCCSINEIFLKLTIYGKNWNNKWDWAFLFLMIIDNLKINKSHETENTTDVLYDDIVQTLDNSKDLDYILTNKDVVLNIIKFHNNCFSQKQSSQQIFKLLAHVFKKFPELWNMQWMFKKYRKTKQHLLKNGTNAREIFLKENFS